MLLGCLLKKLVEANNKIGDTTTTVWGYANEDTSERKRNKDKPCPINERDRMWRHSISQVGKCLQICSMFPKICINVHQVRSLSVGVCVREIPERHQAC